MKAIWIGMLAAVVGVSGCASSTADSQAVAGYDFGGIDSVAIVDVTGRVYGEAVKNQISDMFTIELMRRGYRVIERRNIRALLKEQEFQASDLTTDQSVARVGRILNVPAVMVIDIPRYRDGRMDMTARLLDVEDGTILWIGTGSGSTGRDLSTLLGAVAGAAIGAGVAGGSGSDRAIGAVVGGVAGGVAGHTLAPQQETVVKRVVARVTESLPSRIPQPERRR